MSGCFLIKEGAQGGMRHIYSNVDNPGTVVKDLAIAADVTFIIIFSIFVVVIFNIM